MPRYVVDRFEGTWAVLEDEQGKTFLLPRRWLPTQAGEGDVVIETAQAPDADTVSLRLELGPEGARRAVGGSEAAPGSVAIWP